MVESLTSRTGQLWRQMHWLSPARGQQGANAKVLHSSGHEWRLHFEVKYSLVPHMHKSVQHTRDSDTSALTCTSSLINSIYRLHIFTYARHVHIHFAFIRDHAFTYAHASNTDDTCLTRSHAYHLSLCLVTNQYAVLEHLKRNSGAEPDSPRHVSNITNQIEFSEKTCLASFSMCRRNSPMLCGNLSETIRRVLYCCVNGKHAFQCFKKWGGKTYLRNEAVVL